MVSICIRYTILIIPRVTDGYRFQLVRLSVRLSVRFRVPLLSRLYLRHIIHLISFSLRAWLEYILYMCNVEVSL